MTSPLLPSAKIDNHSFYAIRDDGQWSTHIWTSTRDQKIFQKSLNQLKQTLVRSISESLDFLPIILVNLIDQQKYVDKLLTNNQLINLDNCTTSPLQLGISRLFNLADGQIRSQKLISRPGSLTLKTQLKLIPKGDYYLVDDDIATGQTVNQVKKMLGQNIHVKKDISLLRQNLKKQKLKIENLVDIVDFRDFIIGSRHGGLIASLPDNSICRLPYLLPYVSPVSRAKIPANFAYSFSQKIWYANYIFFKSMSSSILLKDTDPSFQKLAWHIGFNHNSKMSDICHWHYRQLNNCNQI